MKVIVVLSVILGVSLALPEHLFPRQDPNSDVKHWALLTAGSNGWYNYRHQADICHAYQILHKNGIPDERIIVLMYDDIANNPENPNKGVIINKPNGPNVYPGVPKDYNGEDVTPDNFLALLKGEKPVTCNNCSGKVMKSDSNDHVFVYFADHGATDLIAFPEGEVTASKLLKELKQMHKQDKFGQLVFYLEACESGSMFVKLPDNINIYATTAANPDESSWGTYCDNPMDNCLGDEYSIHWMEDSDVEDLTKETLKKQFQIVKNETQKSHPQEYGNLTMNGETLIQYQGGNTQAKTFFKAGDKYDTPLTKLDLVPAPEIEMTMLHRKLMKTTHPNDRDAILDKIVTLATTQRQIIKTIKAITQLAASDSLTAETFLERPQQLRVTNSACYEAAVTHFSDQCFRLGQNDYALRLVYIFANMCEQNVPQDKILSAINRAC